VARQRGDLAAAGSTLAEAGRFVEGHFPADHPARSSLALETALLRLADRSFAEARSGLEGVLAAQRGARARGRSHVLALAALAEAELGLGDGEGAARHAAEASEAAGKLSLPGRPSCWVGRCLLVQARVDRARGRAAAARERSAEALAQLLPTVGEAHPLAREAAWMSRE
jgi:hypothetical protein